MDSNDMVMAVKDQMKSEYYMFELEVMDERIVITALKCAMEDWNGPII